MPVNNSALIKAIQKAQKASPGEAGAIYAKLATQAAKDQLPRRAANLHARAALAYVDAGQEADVLAQSRAALALLAERELGWRAQSVYTGVTRALDAKKLTRALDRLRGDYSQKIIVLAGEARKDPLPVSRLPATCPGCGLVVRADEVDWISAARAECDYCGTVMDAG
jgi:CRISPR/Cas system-associated endoribonuclease Cas2